MLQRAQMGKRRPRALHFVYFVEDCSREIWVYLLKSEDEAFAASKPFCAFVTTQTRQKLKHLDKYNGGEFTNIDFVSSMT